MLLNLFDIWAYCSKIVLREYQKYQHNSIISYFLKKNLWNLIHFQIVDSGMDANKEDATDTFKIIIIFVDHWNNFNYNSLYYWFEQFRNGFRNEVKCTSKLIYIQSNKILRDKQVGIRRQKLLHYINTLITF